MKKIIKNEETKKDVLRYLGILAIVTAVSTWLIVTIMMIAGTIDINKHNTFQNKSCDYKKDFEFIYKSTKDRRKII